jgi:hypothetical protein
MDNPPAPLFCNNDPSAKAFPDVVNVEENVAKAPVAADASFPTCNDAKFPVPAAVLRRPKTLNPVGDPVNSVVPFVVNVFATFSRAMFVELVIVVPPPTVIDPAVIPPLHVGVEPLVAPEQIESAAVDAVYNLPATRWICCPCADPDHANRSATIRIGNRLLTRITEPLIQF